MRTISDKAVSEEILKRRKLAISLSTTEDDAQTVSRLLGCLMKQWITPEGKIWSHRAYLLKYNREEYKNVLHAIKRYYSSAGFDNQAKRSVVNAGLWWHEDLKVDPHVSFDGRLDPIKAYYQKSYLKAA